jgi:hypothetical protein
MAFAVANKNQFFSYFSVVDHNGTTQPAAYREREQVWNAKGIAIKVQGNDWQGGYNGFGKRHLLTTEGGKHANQGGGFKAKMGKVLTKRQGNPGQKRGGNLNKMASSQTTPKDSKGGLAAAEKFKSELGVNKNLTAAHYEVNPYGDKLGQDKPNTMILLDGLTKNEVAEAFADAILNAGPFAEKQAKHVTVTFADARVYVLEKGKVEPDSFNRVEVGVCFDGAIYHVYHCYGAH